MKKAEREFNYNNFYVKVHLVGAFLLPLLGVVLPLLLLGNIVIVGGFPIIIIIILYFLFRNLTVLKIYNEHCEMKFAPAQGVKLIKYKDISYIEKQKYKYIVAMNNGKKIKMPLSIFNKTEREHVLNEFTSKGVQLKTS